MKKLLLIKFLLLAFISSTHAQVIQWATKVISFSSELTPVQYAAKQALGKPNVLPAGGENPNAWSPDRPGRKEFLKVGFEKALNIKQIAIAESYNPSAIYRVLAYDELGNEYVVNTLNPMAIPLKGRMLNLFMPLTAYKVKALKIEFDGAALPEYFGIDAVAISDSSYPIIADIPKMQQLISGILIERLDQNVNSEYNELNPLLSPDGKTLYFSRQNYPGNKGGVNDNEDIWYSELDSMGHWQLAKNMSQFNNRYPNFASSITSITADGKSAILVLGNKYLSNGKVQAGISISSKVGSRWTKPIGLTITDDYNFSQKSNYFLANNRKTLIMSVEREDSYGDRDLYVSFLQHDSIWSVPLNLNDVINTAGTESGPFLAADNKTLYFSSNGFSGYGGSDIYVSRRLDDTWTNWSEPENLGPEINSKLEDLFFNIPARSDYAYYSRGVTDNNTDIFRVKLPIVHSPTPSIIVKGRVVDATGKPLAAKIIYHHLTDDKEAGTAQTNPADGKYEIRLPAGYQYSVRAEAKDIRSEEQKLNLDEIKSDTILNGKDFFVMPGKVQAGQDDVVFTLNNVFFDFGKEILKAESFPELDRIVSTLNEKVEIQVEIVGHTDAVGTEVYNLELSKRRATSVMKYLINKGIPEERISTAFFGERKPKQSNTTELGRKLNRRVEIRILKS